MTNLNSHWECSKCGGTNGMERENCLECGNPRPSNVKSKYYVSKGRYGKTL